MQALACRAVVAALILILTGTANAAFISAENQVDGLGTASWDITYNPDGSTLIGSIDARIWANGLGVTGISGTDSLGNVPLSFSTFVVFSAPSTALECPSATPAGCINYGGWNFGVNTAVDPATPIVIGTFTVNYSSNAPPITLEVLPDGTQFRIAIDAGGNRILPDTTAQVLGTVGVPEPTLFVLLGIGLAGVVAMRRRSSRQG